MNPNMNGDYEEALRRALHAAADSIEPSADGLQRIRERLNRPMLSFESATAWSAGAAAWFRRWMEPVVAAFWAVVDRFRPAPGQPGHARPRYSWIRPVAGMGIAVFVVAAGGFALTELPQVVSPSSASSAAGSSGSDTSHHGTGGGASGPGSLYGNSANPTGDDGHHTAGVTVTPGTNCHTTAPPSKSSTGTGSASSSPTSPPPASSSPPPTSTSPPSDPSPPPTSGTLPPDPGTSSSAPPVSQPAKSKAATPSSTPCASGSTAKVKAPKSSSPASGAAGGSTSSSAPATSPAKSTGTGSNLTASSAPATGATS